MDTTLKIAIVKHAGKQSDALLKHLNAVGIKNWGDLTKAKLLDFKDELLETVCASSAKTYCATLKAFLSRYSDEGLIPCKDPNSILKVHGEKPLKTFLTPEELDMLADVKVKSEFEKFVLLSFLVSAYTGCRISDTTRLTKENISDGFLTYVSKKTSMQATVPCSDRVKSWIVWLNENKRTFDIASFNKTLRRLAERAGINEVVKIFKAGKEFTKPKYECISSHTARISLCTNLANAGVPLLDISRLAGHSNTTMTERYCVPTTVKLNEKALLYFKK